MVMQNRHIRLLVLTPQKTILETSVSKVTLPASKGPFMVLYNHAPVITSLEEGVLVYEEEGKLHSMEIFGGFAEVNDNVVTVCAEV